MATVLSLLLVSSVLVLVCWIGMEHRPGPRPVPVQPGPPGGGYRSGRLGARPAAVIGRAEGVADIGRHDDRRCDH